MAGFKSDFLEKAANRVAEVEKETCNNNPKQIILHATIQTDKPSTSLLKTTKAQFTQLLLTKT